MAFYFVVKFSGASKPNPNQIFGWIVKDINILRIFQNCTYSHIFEIHFILKQIQARAEISTPTSVDRYRDVPIAHTSIFFLNRVQLLLLWPTYSIASTSYPFVAWYCPRLSWFSRRTSRIRRLCRMCSCALSVSWIVWRDYRWNNSRNLLCTLISQPSLPPTPLQVMEEVLPLLANVRIPDPDIIMRTVRKYPDKTEYAL